VPEWLRIGGDRCPRDGMPIGVLDRTVTAPQGFWLPDKGVAPYRGRS
jgi:hypothetical protein